MTNLLHKTSLPLYPHKIEAKHNHEEKMLPSTTTSDQPDAATAWSAQADLYADRSSRITELHASDLVAYLRPHLLQAQRVLEIGCGTGAFGQAYLQAFPKGIPNQHILMTDVAPGMLDKAKESITTNVPANYATQFEFLVQDGTTLDGIDSDSIDLVVSCFGVFLIPNQAAALQAIARVLKPNGGIFGNASWAFPISSTLQGLGVGPGLQEIFFLPMETIDPIAFAEQQQGIAKWSSETNIRNLFNQQDFVGSQNLRPVSFTKAIHSTSMDWDFFWQLMDQNPVSQTIYRGATPAQKKATQEAVLQVLQSHGQNDPKTNSIFLSAVSLLTIFKMVTKNVM